MKKLKNKVFFTIFGIFTIFTFSILLVNNIQNYNKEYKNVSNQIEMNFRPRKNIIDEDNMRFIDADIYTVHLNKDRTIRKISNNSFNEYDLIDINNLINTIISKEEGKYIDNLYTSDFAYKFSNNKIVIMSLSKVNSEIKSILKASILLFISAELIAVLIS